MLIPIKKIILELGLENVLGESFKKHVSNNSFKLVSPKPPKPNVPQRNDGSDETNFYDPKGSIKMAHNDSLGEAQ